MDYYTEKGLDKYEIKQPTQRKFNKYDLSGEYGIGYSPKGEEFYFDLDDYDKIKDYYWQFNNRGYAYFVFRRNKKNIKVFLHRLILNPESDMTVDHINGVRHDNRKTNLRIATPEQNNYNRRMLDSNTSGCTGVTWIKERNRWRASLEYKGKKIGLGFYRNFEDAVKARRAGEDKYYGEYSYNNSRGLKNGNNTD